MYGKAGVPVMLATGGTLVVTAAPPLLWAVCASLLMLAGALVLRSRRIRQSKNVGSA